MSYFPLDPEKFVAYFARVNRNDPSQHWAFGLEVAEQWQSLSSQEQVSQADVDGLLARLRDETCCGTGWIEMRMHFERWAKQRGFRV
jgi:hypothetical protein